MAVRMGPIHRGQHKYRFSCSRVSCCCQCLKKRSRALDGRLTISSLQMGHTSLLEALAAAFSAPGSRTLLVMSSLVSAVLAGLLEVWELRDKELSEGDSVALRRWAAGGRGDTAGDRLRPLPSTRPPPRDLPEVMMCAVARVRRGSYGSWGTAALTGVLHEVPGAAGACTHRGALGWGRSASIYLCMCLSRRI